MQARIAAEDAGSAPAPADLLTDAFSVPSMLGACTEPECATIVFGQGTCVTHDPAPMHLAATLLDEAFTSGAGVSHR